MRRLLLAVFLCTFPFAAHADNYTLNHGLCVNATTNTNLVAKDCGGIPLQKENNLSELPSASTARANLGLTIGTNVQAFDADLSALAALSSTAGILKRTGAGAFGLAVSGTDYAPATTGSAILKASGGGFANAVSGTDYAPATGTTNLLLGNGSGGFTGYGGASCTNQFMRSFSTNGSVTCASVAISTDVSGFGTGVASLLAGTASGSGGPAGTTSPTFTTPVLGAATGTSLALGGATIGSNALAVTGNALFNNAVTITGSRLQVNGDSAGVVIRDTGSTQVAILGPAFKWLGSGSTTDFAIGANGTNFGLYVGGAATPTLNLTGIYYQQPQTTVVGSLATCNSAAKGTHAIVTDATAPAFNTTLVGGGAVTVPAFCDGTNWKAI